MRAAGRSGDTEGTEIERQPRGQNAYQMEFTAVKVKVRHTRMGRQSEEHNGSGGTFRDPLGGINTRRLRQQESEEAL